MLAFLERLDHQLFFALNQGLSTVGLDYLLWLVTWCADGFILVAIVGVVLWCVDRQTLHRHYRWLLVAVLIGSLVVQAIKFGVARPRPLREFAAWLEAGTIHINVIGPSLRHRSFPSGHTQVMASVSMYLFCLYPRQWYWWGASLFLVGLSRIYVGMHFPLDVLAGALLGMLSTLGVWHWRRACSAAAAGDAPISLPPGTGADVREQA
jgi:undecaprenyl-diphosphatase